MVVTLRTIGQTRLEEGAADADPYLDRALALARRHRVGAQGSFVRGFDLWTRHRVVAKVSRLRALMTSLGYPAP